ncbi:MAG: DUF2442 domain-containing protein [Pyrinomonadaceae bacterium]|nr:DUF2442 domain-containing protein [Pyrinomonadaceae bacterium]
MGKKIKLGKFEVDEDELERQFVAATARGKKFLAEAPKAVKVRFDRETKRLVLDLENGATLIVPTENIQGLRGAADKDLAEIELLLERTTLHWEKLDVDFSVSSLMNGVFGTPKWMSELNSKASANNKPQQKKVA